MATIIAKGQITIVNLNDGNDGVSIVSVVEEYYLSTSSTELIGGEWSTKAPTPLKGTYVWARTRITFSDGTETVTSPVRITGEGGVDGTDAYTVILSNECHSVLCNSAAVPNENEIGATGRAFSDILVYKGTKKLTAINTGTPTTDQFIYSIGTVNGGTAGRKDSDTFYLNTMTSNFASIPISINVENKQTVSKVMSITKSIAGVDGEDGISASYVNILASSLFFKCASDSSIYTPNTIELKPIFINSTYSSWQYSSNGGSWSDVISGQNGLTISSSQTGNSLTISNSCNLFTSSVSSVSFKVSGTNGASDVTTIAKLKDGNTGANGTSITSVDLEYYLSTSKTTTTGGSWLTTAPEWVDERYMWTRTKTTYSGGSTSYTTPVCMGELGTGISSITEEYYLSNSKTSQAGGSWQPTPPEWKTNTYLWTRSKIIYKNPVSTVYTTPVCDSSWEVINDIQVGGRNLWLKSKTVGEYTIETLGENHITGQTECYKITNEKHISYNIEPDFSPRLYRKLTFSAWIKYENVVEGPNSWNKFNIFKHDIIRKNSATGVTSSPDYLTLESFVGTSDWKYVKYTYDLSSNKNYDMLKTGLRFRLEGTTSGTAWITAIQIEYGDKATDWTPAPEDINESINSSVASVDVMYYLSTSNTSLIGGSWTTVAPEWANGKYMWSKTVTTLKGGSIIESTPTCISGATGSTGNGISSIKEQYYLSTSSTTVTGGSWLDNAPSPVRGKYIWTRSIVTFTNGDSTTTDPIRATGDIGADGSNGSNGTDSVNILLDNENHTFVGTSDGNAIASTIVVNILGFKGTTRQACTIGNIAGTPSGMTVTPSGSGTTNAKLTIAVTSSMSTTNGTVTIPVTCSGVTINKIFTFSIAVAGNNGENAKSADIVPTTKIFKSTNGGISFSPNSITLNQILKNVSFSKWQYSIDGGVTWINAVNGSSGITIASNNLTISETSSLFTRDITTISFKLITNDPTIYDTETISKVYDVTDLQIGARNLVRNSAFLLGNKYWSFSSNVIIDDSVTFNGNPSCKSSQTGLTSDNWRGCINYNLVNNPTSIEAGKYYSYSCWYYVEDKTTIDSGITLEIKGKRTGQTTESGISSVYIGQENIVEKKWTRMTKVVSPDYDFNECCIRAFVRRNGTAWFTNFKFETGNTITEWCPATEDVLEELYDSLGQAEESIKKDYEAGITTLKDRIDATVKETTTIKDNIATMTESFESKITQTSTDLRTTFTEMNSVVVGDLQAYKTEVQTMIRQSADGIEIGKSDSRLSTQLSNNKLAFKDDGVEVAYISQKEMNITNAVIKENLSIGGYQFKPRSNGNMSLVWKV